MRKVHRITPSQHLLNAAGSFGLAETTIVFPHAYAITESHSRLRFCHDEWPAQVKEALAKCALHDEHH